MVATARCEWRLRKMALKVRSRLSRNGRWDRESRSMGRRWRYPVEKTPRSSDEETQNMDFVSLRWELEEGLERQVG